MTALDVALRKTGFVGPKGMDAPGLRRASDAQAFRLEPAFSSGAGLVADAVYETEDGPKLIVKTLGGDEAGGVVHALHERAWNLGLAPLLWFVTPTEVRVYDAFSGSGEAEGAGPLGTYRIDVASEMDALDAFCGRFSIDTGAFWESDLGRGIDRSRKVDQLLLKDIAALEELLVQATPDGKVDPNATRARCQEIVTCTLFALYLIERGIAKPKGLAGHDLAETYRSRAATLDLFDWLHENFNGDVFPKHIGSGLHDAHLPYLEDFVRGTGLAQPDKGQYRLFRFRFAALPAELISSIYEAFARRSAGKTAKRLSLHYTSVDLVHMALDPVFEGLPDDARILDMTCGSGRFLVEALRRFVWKRCGTGPRPRSLVRKILYGQIFGIELEPAALRIAAFSLYLSALELESCAEEDETTRFERLIGKTLHRFDFLSQEAQKFARGLGLDAIVGNPPWTHVSKAPSDDTQVDDGSDGSGRFLDASGIGENDQPDEGGGARRSPEHKFLSAAMSILGPRGRISLYLKATPMLSRAPDASAYRDRILTGLDRIALLSLAPLRHEGLFSAASGPGLLLCANCDGLPEAGKTLVGTFPWSPDYKRTGSLALSSADVSVVETDYLLSFPSALKASMVGTPRDVRLMERLERDFKTLRETVQTAGIVFGQGFQVRSTTRNTKPISPLIARLPALFPENYQPLGINRLDLPNLQERGISSLLYERSADIYKGPLVVFSKSGHRKALHEGRPSAAMSSRDIAFSHGFYGFSFARADHRLAPVLCAILNSALASFQFLFGAGALGMERPSILPQDLLSTRMPAIEIDNALYEAALAALSAARQDECSELDTFVARLYGLSPDERDLVRDAVRRGRSTFLDTIASRADDAVPPTTSDLSEYAEAACRTVNAVLRFGGRRHLVAKYRQSKPFKGDPLDRFVAVRFEIVPGRRPSGTTSAHPADHDLFEGLLPNRLVKSPVPYLKERRSVRVYGPENVTVVKPAQRRYWNVASGMQDGDAILADHWPGHP